MIRRMIVPLAVLASLLALLPQSPYRTHNDRLEPPRFTSAVSVGAARAVSPRACAGVGRFSPDAGADAPPPRGLRRNHPPGLHGVEGLLREPARVLRYRKPVSSDRRRSVPGRAVAARPLDLRPSREHRDQLGAGRAIGLARQGFVVFTHDMVGDGDSPAVDAHLRRTAGEPLGLEPRRPAVVEFDRALDFLETLPYVRRDGSVSRGSGGGTQTFLLASIDLARGGGGAGQHDLAAHAGRVHLREHARPAPRHQQPRDCRDHRSASAPDDLGDRRLDGGNDGGRVPGDAQPLLAARRRREGPRGPLHRRAQLQQGQPRGDVRLDGALAAARARRCEAARAAVQHR